MDNELSFERKDNRLCLKGVLTFATVPSLLQQQDALLAYAEELEVDLQFLTKSDSAGIALLIAWTRQLRNEQRSITFLNVPKQLRTMARVSGLESILPLA